MTETEFDKMLMVKVLYERMNWSYRRIARLFKQSTSTIISIYNKSLYQLDEENLNNPSIGEVSLMYVGGTNEVEYADADVNHLDTGGGRKVNNAEKRI